MAKSKKQWVDRTSKQLQASQPEIFNEIYLIFSRKLDGPNSAQALSNEWGYLSLNKYGIVQELRSTFSHIKSINSDFSLV